MLSGCLNGSYFSACHANRYRRATAKKPGPPEGLSCFHALLWRSKVEESVGRSIAKLCHVVSACHGHAFYQKRK